VFEFILAAVDLVASEGWRLLPEYRFDPATGMWRHRNKLGEAPLSLRDVTYDGGTMKFVAHRHQAPDSTLAGYLAEARGIVAGPRAASPEPLERLATGPDFEDLRWFWLPEEIDAELARA